MLDEGEKLVPGLPRGARAAGLGGSAAAVQTGRAKATDTRDVTRTHAVLDHSARDGSRGFLTITGGKRRRFG